MEQVPQERLIVSLRRQFGDHPSVEFTYVERSEVAEPLPLQPTPQPLHRVEHRRERRQPLQAQPVGEVGLIRIPESLRPLPHVLSIADTLDLVSIEAHGA